MDRQNDESEKEWIECIRDRIFKSCEKSSGKRSYYLWAAQGQNISVYGKVIWVGVLSSAVLQTQVAVKQDRCRWKQNEP